MHTDKEVVSLLRDIRDLIQVLVVRDNLNAASLDLSDAPERHSRSWSLMAHRNAAHPEDESDDPIQGPYDL